MAARPEKNSQRQFGSTLRHDVVACVVADVRRRFVDLRYAPVSVFVVSCFVFLRVSPFTCSSVARFNVRGFVRLTKSSVSGFDGVSAPVPLIGQLYQVS